MRQTLIAALGLACAACAQSAGNNASADTVVNTPEAAPATNAAMPAAPAAIPPSALAFLRQQVGGDDQANVAAATADLDGDGAAEVIAYVSGPMLCGSGGCDAYVLTPDGDGWRRVMRSSVTQLPIHLLPERSNGWSDLMLSVSGGGAAGGQAWMTFDGSAYPGNPTADPAVPMAAPAGTVLIAADDRGQPLP